jgi:hypothetical protein
VETQALRLDVAGREPFRDPADARFPRDDAGFLHFSEPPTWVVEHAEELEAARSRIKAAPRPEAFFSQERGPAGSDLVPDFAAVPT